MLHRDTESKAPPINSSRRRTDLRPATANCSWEQTATYDTCASPNAPIPDLPARRQFKSIDGCNECEMHRERASCAPFASARAAPRWHRRSAFAAGRLSCAPQDAKKCPDGSYTSRFGPRFKVRPAAAARSRCDASARISGTARRPSPSPTRAKQICPGDGDPGDDPGTACPVIPTSARATFHRSSSGLVRSDLPGTPSTIRRPSPAPMTR